MADDSLSLIISALQNSDKQAAESNPWAGVEGIGNSLGDLTTKAASSGKYGLNDVLLSGFVSGLIGGAGSSLGDSYKARQNQLAQDYLFGSDASTAPDGLDSNIFNSLRKTRSVFDLANTLDATSDYRRGNIDARKTLLQALANANTPAQQERVLSIGKTMGLIPNDADLGSARTMTPAKEPTVSNIFPGSSFNDQRRKLLQESLDMGLPGGAAQKETEDTLAAYKAANKENVDKVELSRTRAKTLSEIANTAELGMSGAGETGGLLNPIREAASSVYQLINPEERQQRANQKILDSVGPMMVQLNRTPGATSDIEFKTYMGTSPSSANTPQENAAIIERLKNVAGLEEDYASFLEAYRAEKGTTLPTPGSPGAEALWKDYMKQNPAIVRTSDGQLDWNPKRMDWRQYFFNRETPSQGTTINAPQYEIRIDQATGKKYKVLLGQ